MSGLNFGAAVNYQAVIDHACAFDFIDAVDLMRRARETSRADLLPRREAVYQRRIPASQAGTELAKRHIWSEIIDPTRRNAR
jgi:hypothetical protein